MPWTLPHWSLHQWNNETAKTKGSEEDFPWHDDVRATAAVAEFTASFQRKLLCSCRRAKTGSTGLGPTAGSGYLATPKLGALSDGIVREREERGGAGGEPITQRAFFVASAAVREEKLDFIKSRPRKTTCHRPPNLATQTQSVRLEERRPSIKRHDLRHFPGETSGAQTCSLWPNTAQCCAHTH